MVVGMGEMIFGILTQTYSRFFLCVGGRPRNYFPIRNKQGGKKKRGVLMEVCGLINLFFDVLGRGRRDSKFTDPISTTERTADAEKRNQTRAYRRS